MKKMMDIPPPFQSIRQAIVKFKNQQINRTMQKKDQAIAKNP
jgi:hypothetical protein